jgi:hypothetical protein
MGYMVKPGDVVNFDGATLTQREKSLHFIKQAKTLQLPWMKGRVYHFGLVKL